MKGIKTSFITKEKIPLVIEPESPNVKFTDFLKLLEDQNAELKKQMLTHGGLLFRNFPVSNADDFAAVIEQLNTGKFLDYIGGDSPRNKIREGIYTSTEAPPTLKIPLHNELSFVKYHPKHIYFYCNIAQCEGGETILGDSRQIYKSINKDVLTRLKEKQLKYVSCYYNKSPLIEFINKYAPSHKPWRTVFETIDKKEVEKKCVQNEFAYKWMQNDWLQIAQTRPPVAVHPETGDNVWFNQIHLYDFNPKLLGFWYYIGAKLIYARKHMRLHEVYYADGSKIPREDIYHILDTLDANTIAFPWKKGDVLVLDNVLTMHGRAAFKGKRRILAAMTG